MSKIATYLRGHLLGEVDFRADVRKIHSKDAGVLKIAPEMVISPRDTNDIRKAARLVWQLAERGHKLPLVARGSGHGTMGGSIGKGAIITTAPHMNEVFEYDSKQKLVRLQPGATLGAIRAALGLQGAGIMALDGLDDRRTIGGVISDNAAGFRSAKYGDLNAAIGQLEVVLASGDVLQTGPLSKRELSQKKGLQNLEGDIYRGVDRILDEYRDVIESLPPYDKSGFSGIARVRRNGNFDLTPLFFGASGALGIISEMILRTDFRSQNCDVAALTFESVGAARDAMANLAELKPAFAEYFDAKLFENAAKFGRKFAWLEQEKAPQAVILLGFDNFNARARARGLKKLQRDFGDLDGVRIVDDAAASDSIKSALEIAHYTILPDASVGFSPQIYNDIFIPTDRFADFKKALVALEAKFHCELPLAGHALAQTYSVYPKLALRQVGDKQKLLKLLDELAKIASKCNGALIGGASEGRVAAHMAQKQLDARTREMYAEIKKVFDPFGLLAPGVKSADNLRAIASSIDNELSV